MHRHFIFHNVYQTTVKIIMKDAHADYVPLFCFFYYDLHSLLTLSCMSLCGVFRWLHSHRHSITFCRLLKSVPESKLFTPFALTHCFLQAPNPPSCLRVARFLLLPAADKNPGNGSHISLVAWQVSSNPLSE